MWHNLLLNDLYSLFPSGHLEFQHTFDYGLPNVRLIIIVSVRITVKHDELPTLNACRCTLCFDSYR
jgi:hypothetical protein